MEETEYRQYLEIINKITDGDERSQDLLHDILIQLSTNIRWNELTTPNEKKYFFIRTVQNQYKSNNSYFNKVYRKFKTETYDFEDTPDEEYYERPSLKWVIDTLENEIITNPSNWYNVGLFRLYLEHKRVEVIHKKTHIPRYSIRETIKEMKQWLRTKWDEQWEK